MKRLGLLVVGLALVGCDSDPQTPTGPSLTGPIVFTSELLASREVPPVSNAESAARGSVTITFNVPRDTSGAIVGGGAATFAMQLAGFPRGTPAILAHIHPGATGVNGPALVNTGLSPAAPLLLSDGTAAISITVNTLTMAQAVQVAADPAGYYFNVHTALNPGGAVRGQLTRIR